MDAFTSAWNENAEPFVWTKKRSANAASKAGVSLNSDSGY
jgi:hypothetical protein